MKRDCGDIPASSSKGICCVLIDADSTCDPLKQRFDYKRFVQVALILLVLSFDDPHVCIL
eukprot:5066249-Ditylum_brightwellii.AAC.1